MIYIFFVEGGVDDGEMNWSFVETTGFDFTYPVGVGWG